MLDKKAIVEDKQSSVDSHKLVVIDADATPTPAVDAGRGHSYNCHVAATHSTKCHQVL